MVTNLTGNSFYSDRRWQLLTLCVLGAVAVLALAWVGFIGSDDHEYYTAGRAMSQSFWNAPSTFGGMRLAITLPIALSLGIFGDHEWALVLPTSLYAIATVAVSYLAMARFVRPLIAALTAMIFVTLPVTATMSTIASADLAELFWAVCGFWLAMEALRSEGSRQSRLMVGVGVCVALAFAGRETAASMIIWLGLGFLFGFGLARQKYLWSAFGFLAAIAVECAYFAVALGDPFVRFRALTDTRSAVHRMAVTPLTFDDSGTLRIHTLVDPLVMMFTKHSFGVLYWALVAVVLLVWLKGRDSAGSGKQLTRPLVSATLPAAVLGIIWTLFAAIMLAKLRNHPRYYMAPTYFLVVAAACWFSQSNLLGLWRRRIIIALLVLFLANFMGIWAENKNPRFAERALSEMAMKYREPIHTDKATAFIASALHQWNGGDKTQIIGTPPLPGQLHFRVLSGVGAANRQSSATAINEQSSETLERRTEPPLLTGLLADLVNRWTMIPVTLRHKLTASRSEAQLVRLRLDNQSQAQK